MKNHPLRRVLILFFGTWICFGIGLVWLYLLDPKLSWADPFLYQSIHSQNSALFRWATAGVLIQILGLGTLAWVWLRNPSWQSRGRRLLAEHTAAIDHLKDSSLGFWIFFAAGLGLYTELAMIRLHGAFFQMFAHFKNVSLLSCFLGLGIGYAQRTQRLLTTPLTLPLLALQILFMTYLRFFGLNIALLNPASEQVTLGLTIASTLPAFLTAYGFLSFIFVLNALCFIPLGQLASHLMARQPKLVAYGWNLAGSLAGILFFSLLSFLWAPPAIWILFVILGLIGFLHRSVNSLPATTLAAALLLVSLIVPLRPFQLELYSPYQILTVIGGGEYPILNANNTWLQTLLDLRPENVQYKENLKEAADYYALPYSFKPQPERVLIVGSGTGNDVASAVRHGAAEVDAVEIDPAIVHIGKWLHPEYPYQNTNVHIVVDDARAYLRHTGKKYDLIVYGLLDSSASSGGASGMRMDSFVSTVEAFREARRKLKPGGIISMTVCTLPQLGPEIFQMLKDAFDGQEPLAFQTNYDSGFTFLIGEGLTRPAEPPPFTELTQEYSAAAPVDRSTDDWPFIFMFKRAYPFSYVAVLLVLFALSFFLIRQGTPGSGHGFSAPCFFLGTGFMLIETKGITELSLVYGSTWIVNSVVIAAVLLMAFLANEAVLKRGAPPPVITYGLIAASIAAGLTLSSEHLSHFSPWHGRLIMTGLLTLPLFFSGLAFSSELERCPSIGMALSSNLLGAMVGGFLEYHSMYFGFRSLYFFALAIYGAAFLASRRLRQPKERHVFPSSCGKI